MYLIFSPEVCHEKFELITGFKICNERTVSALCDPIRAYIQNTMSDGERSKIRIEIIKQERLRRSENVSYGFVMN